MVEASSSTLVLVSTSPRRQRILEQRGFRVHFVSPPQELDELAEGEAESVVLENSKRKVEGFLSLSEDKSKGRLKNVYLGVDTIVVHEGEILGKPRDEEDARRMLKSLSGKVHTVLSGLYLYRSTLGGCSASSKTEVSFRDISFAELEFYLQTGEAFDKAGAYGIQAWAGLFVKSIRGCYYNVVGLPLATLCETLGELELSVTDLLLSPGESDGTMERP